MNLTGIPVHKDRVILAIYMKEALNHRPKEDLQNDLTSQDRSIVENFKELLGTRIKLVEELDTYIGEQTDKPVKLKVLNTLEVNLMLAFIWLGCLTSDLPVLETDVLMNAQSDKYGYLSEYQVTM